MPILHRCRAVQIHVPKTGGQTASRVLGCSYLPKDLYGTDGDWELSHLSMQLVRELYSDVPRDYYSFAFVRDPWDRLVSGYHYRCCEGYCPYLPGAPVPPDFVAFVRAVSAVDVSRLTRTQANHLYPQWDFVHDQKTGARIVDYVGRYESFEADLRAVCSRLEFCVGDVPRVNATAHDHYSTYYDAETAGMVGRLYARDAEAFNYLPPV